MNSFARDTQGEGLNTNGKISLLLATTLALLSTAIVSPAMPDIAAEFANEIHSEWLPKRLYDFVFLLSDAPSVDFLTKLFILSVPAFFIVIGAPLAGIVSDMVGRRRVLAAALILFAVSGASGFFTQSLTPLIVGRAILGLSVAGIKACTVAMVADYFQGDARNKFIGLQGAAMKLGGVGFLLLGGLLADISWRAPFLVYLISFVALPGVVFYLYDVHCESDETVVRSRLPWRAMSFVLFSAFAASVFFFMILVQTPFFLDQAFGSSRTQMGIASATANAVAGVVAAMFFWFKARLSYIGMFAFVYVLIGVGFGVVSVAPVYPAVLAGLAIAGIGIGLIIPAQSAWMLAIAPAGRRGMAIGLVATAMYCGQFIAPLMIEPFVDPDNPFKIFTVASGVLLLLGGIYAVIAIRTRGWQYGQTKICV